MALHICRETFTGEFVAGKARTFQAGVDVLDSANPDEAKMLKAFAIYFAPVVERKRVESATAAPGERRA